MGRCKTIEVGDYDVSQVQVSVGSIQLRPFTDARVNGSGIVLDFHGDLCARLGLPFDADLASRPETERLAIAARKDLWRTTPMDYAQALDSAKAEADHLDPAFGFDAKITNAVLSELRRRMATYNDVAGRSTPPPVMVTDLVTKLPEVTVTFDSEKLMTEVEVIRAINDALKKELKTGPPPPITVTSQPLGAVSTCDTQEIARIKDVVRTTMQSEMRDLAVSIREAKSPTVY